MLPSGGNHNFDAYNLDGRPHSLIGDDMVREDVDPEEGAATVDRAAEEHRNTLNAFEGDARRMLEHNSAVSKAKGVRTHHDTKAAQRRLMRDFHTLQHTLNSSTGGATVGISAHPIDGDLFHWRAIIAGPVDTPWDGGLFKLDLKFSPEYPLTPPNVRFLTKNVFHPNVYVNGDICLDTLQSSWSPTLDVETLLLSIRSLLSDPNPNSAANGEAAKMLVENVLAYEIRVRRLVEESLDQSFSDIEDDKSFEENANEEDA